MPRFSFRALTACVIVMFTLGGMTACVADSSEAEGPGLTTWQGAISGGYTDEDDTAVVGIVALSGGGGIGICTGTLITPNIVLTAQHCVAPVVGGGGGVNCATTSFAGAYDAGFLFVSTRTQLSQNPNDYISTANAFVPPGAGFCGRDVALLVLDYPVPADEATPMVPRVDVPVVADTPWMMLSGEDYSAIGYGTTGQNESGQSGKRRRLDGLKASCVGVACGMSDSIYDEEWLGDTGVCQGDSGGPAVDSVGRVIGVASRGGGDCAFPIYGSVYAWRDWIRDLTVAQSQATGLEAPGWALGHATHPAFAIDMGGSCATAEDCESGACQFGYCSRPCLDEAPCPEGFYCSPETEYCTHLEVGGDCVVDADCGGGTCLDGYCTRVCLEVPSCPDGFGCDAELGLCALLPVGGFCDAACDVCVDDYCSRPCDDGLPCPEGFACDGGVCVAPTLGGACTDDGDCDGGVCSGDGMCSRPCGLAGCPDGWACDIHGLCAPAPVGWGCVDDGDCPGGFCAMGTCTRHCDESAPCPSGWTCGPGAVCEASPSQGCGAAPSGAWWYPWVAFLLVGWMTRRRRGPQSVQSVLSS